MTWKRVSDVLPAHDQRVLVWLPDNAVYLPGKTGATEQRNCVIMRFQKDFFGPDNPKRSQYGAHFWLGAGQSNRYFNDVSHWMALPNEPDSM